MILQQLAMYILRTTLKQCENLTIEILYRELDASESEVKKLINVLHDENVIYYKYNYVCPRCREIDTILEREKDEVTKCSICGKEINVEEILKGAIIVYSLDKEDFKEYMEENYSDIFELTNREYKKTKEIKKAFQINNVLSKEDFKLVEGEKMSNEKETKIFISHSENDKDYTDALVELLHNMGIPKNENNKIFCSSKEGYGIPLGKGIYEYIKSKFQENIIVLFVLSKGYYKSAACLNEMGATWIGLKDHYTLLLPDFEYKEIKGAINPMEISFKLDNKDKLTELKEILAEKMGLPEINSKIWEESRDRFLEKISELKERDRLANYPYKIQVDKVKSGSDKSQLKVYIRFVNNSDIPVEFTNVDITLIDSDDEKFSFKIPEGFLENKIIYSKENRREEVIIDLINSTKYDFRKNKRYESKVDVSNI